MMNYWDAGEALLVGLNCRRRVIEHGGDLVVGAEFIGFQNARRGPAGAAEEE